MKNSIQTSLGLALLVGLTQLNVRAADPHPGFIDFGKLSPAGAGSEFVEVNISNNLIAMAARLTQKTEPEITSLLQGLHSIRVNVIGLNNENRAEVEDRVKAIRSQLDTQGWERIVTAQKKKEDVGVYLKTRGPEAVEGVVVTVLDGKKQAVLINIVGDISPDKLGILGERFNIDPLKQMGNGAGKQAAEDE